MFGILMFATYEADLTTRMTLQEKERVESVFDFESGVDLQIYVDH